MITAYHRPRTLEEALQLIGRSEPPTFPLGGGTLLSHTRPEAIEVVDLQALGLNTIRKKGNNLEIGATVTLQQLLEHGNFPACLKSAITLDAPLNLRNAATVAGSLVAADGRSTFAASMLALDARLKLQPNDQEMAVGELLPLRAARLRGKLITRLDIPLNVQFAFEYVARTPADKPVVCAALTIWPSGRTRLALGGYGTAPHLAMDGTESEGLETAAQNAFQEAEDEWATAEYRRSMAVLLAKRCKAALVNA